MENASKALIIAGAIIISIILISVGVFVVQKTKGFINTDAMSELEIQQFNQRFIQYEGDRVRGATVNQMVNAVIANNVSQDDPDRQIKITGAVTLAEDATATTANTVKNGAIYGVKCVLGTTGGEKGLVQEIQVTKK